jgi:hypothetical protein
MVTFLATATICAGLCTASEVPTLERVLALASSYVAEFEQQLAGIAAEEEYVQEVHPAPGRSIPEEYRRMRSDLLLVKPSGAREWLQFRDVFEVNGDPVRDRSERLSKLFAAASGSIDARIRAIVEESARFNIGPVTRTINAPILALMFLEARNQKRFRFKLAADTMPSRMTSEPPVPPGHFRIGTEVWAIEYVEHEQPTIIRARDEGSRRLRDLPARGRFWIEPATGRVLMSELTLVDRHVRGVITVNYQSEPLLGLLVPVEMRERYDRLKDKSVVDGFASYGRFRQVPARVDEKRDPVQE